MQAWAKQTKGFTLVELLIVIVIIAILAAITIVAYNGIQARAKLTQQVSEMNRIGKAIELWTTEKGVSLASSGTGWGGTTGYGSFTGAGGSYGAISIEDLLVNAGYLTKPVGGAAFADSNVLLAPCTTNDNPRWVVMATVSPVPTQSVSDQIAATGCTNSLINTYTDPAGSYKRNLVRVY